MMKRIPSVMLSAILLSLLQADAQNTFDAAVSQVTMAQKANSRIVEINYVLEHSPAIITLSVETNGVALPGSAVSHLTGDVSSLIQPGAHTITWDAGTDWSEEKAENAKAVITAWPPNDPPPYCSIDLAAGTTATNYPVHYYPDQDAVPNGVTNDLYKTTRILMRKVGPTPPAGFQMGSPIWEKGRECAGGVGTETCHQVILTKAYYLAIYETTQYQWELVIGDMVSRPSYFRNLDHWMTRPVEQISSFDIREKIRTAKSSPAKDPEVYWPSNSFVNAESFMGRLRTKTGLQGLDLPTAAQWEFACRAGTVSARSYGVVDQKSSIQENRLDKLARNKNNSGYKDGEQLPQSSDIDQGTAKVGSYLPNAWGFYDMYGNVSEICLDNYWAGEYDFSTKIDPKGPERASWKSFRIHRGGSFQSSDSFCRSAFTIHVGQHWTSTADIGFRLCWHLQ